eukprot:1157751-Pelagomonas_calceolata.AAC.7
MHFFSAELVPLGEPCCVLDLHVCALSLPDSPPVCLNPPAAPPSLQMAPKIFPECRGGHLLRAGGRLFWGALQSQPRGVLTMRNGFEK